LREEDWPLFNALRDWRSGVARAEGVPPYIVVPNEVLASIARERPTSLNALGQLRGMGEARLKRHGRALLEALGVAAAPRQGEGVAAEPATAGGERGSDAATEDAVDASS
jgi:ATP-dependent DNA helicase RecQ